MKFKEKFNFRELSGAFGDWGTLVPFIIGYISIVKFNPAGIFFCLGITNIVLGIRFNLPLPVQPQKTIGTVALSQKWNSSLVLSTGFGLGMIWTALGFTRILNKLVKKVPIIAVRGIQLGLGLILGWSAINLMTNNWLLALISILIIFSLIKFEKFPTALILVGIGLFVLFIQNKLTLNLFKFGIPIFQFYVPDLQLMLIGMIYAGIAQFFLTLTNVMIATISLIKDLFPDERDNLDANTLATNMGLMNIFSTFFSGIPLCHGSGGLAAQYAFGARTGGSMILEGIIEIFLGLFFSETLLLIFSEFPSSILGSMLIYTALLLGKMAFKDYSKKKLPIIVLSALTCLVFNILIGFLVGLILFYIFRKFLNQNKLND
ncbi:MAG: putative sulfate/molybdate transporter [Promethearchaeota archaeon]